MTLRERIADWISGGQTSYEADRIAFWRNMYDEECKIADQFRAEAATIAAQRDEAIARAEVAEKAKRDLALDVLAADGQAQEAYEAQLAAQAALRAILTARNITEARKIAKQALGEE